jgi:hypothetical protein
VVVVEQTKEPAVLVRRGSTAEPRQRTQARILALEAAVLLRPDPRSVLVVTEKRISVLPTRVAVALGSSRALAQRVVAAEAARAAIRPERLEPLTPEAVVEAPEAPIQRAAAPAVRVVPAS